MADPRSKRSSRYGGDSDDAGPSDYRNARSARYLAPERDDRRRRPSLSPPPPYSSHFTGKGLDFEDAQRFSLPFRPPPRRQRDGPDSSRHYIDPPDAPPARHPRRSRNSELSDERNSSRDTPFGAGPAPYARDRPPRSDARSDTRPRSKPSVLGTRQYQYKELEPSCIRLLKLLPARKTVVQCEMIHVSMDGPPRYMAISYAWGDARDTINVELEGAVVPVSASLHGALNALRHRSKPVLVWADALCIDQGNGQERTEQVALMTRIYAEAGKVAMWLGPEDDDSAIAISFLRTIAEVADRGSSDEFEHLVASEAAESRAGRFSALVDLFEREYWHRLWVVQEFINARSVMVCCGSTKMNWSTLEKVAYFLDQHGMILQYHLVTNPPCPELLLSPRQASTYKFVLTQEGPWTLMRIERFITSKDVSLLDALNSCRYQLASDPKDKLFGILGILPGHIQQHFRADYAMSVKEVYTEIVDYIIKTSGSLNVICEAIRYPAASNDAGLPSFVPDWSKSSTCHKSMSEVGKRSFRASMETKAQCRFLDGRLSRLEISALYIDKVVMSGEICPDGPLGNLSAAGIFLHWRSVLLDAIQPFSKRRRHLAEVDFAQTLCFGKPPDEWLHDPEEWLRVVYKVAVDFSQRYLPYTALDDALLNYPEPKASLSGDRMDEIFKGYVKRGMMGHTVCLTEDGFVGCGTGALVPDDIVVVPLGCDTPILLRQYGTKGQYVFIGDVYLHGFMHGKAIRDLDSGRHKLETFVLR